MCSLLPRFGLGAVSTNFGPIVFRLLACENSDDDLQLPREIEKLLEDPEILRSRLRATSSRVTQRASGPFTTTFNEGQNTGRPIRRDIGQLYNSSYHRRYDFDCEIQRQSDILLEYPLLLPG